MVGKFGRPMPSAPSSDDSSSSDEDYFPPQHNRAPLMVRRAIPLVTVSDSEEEDNANVGAQHGRQERQSSSSPSPSPSNVDENRSNGGGGDEDANSLASVNEAEPAAGRSPGLVPDVIVERRPVGGFRVRQGPDGEEVVEFVSDGEEDEEEEEHQNNDVELVENVDYGVGLVPAEVADEIFRDDRSYVLDVLDIASESDDSDDPAQDEQRIPRRFVQLPGSGLEEEGLSDDNDEMEVDDVPDEERRSQDRLEPYQEGSESSDDDNEQADPAWFEQIGVEPAVQFAVDLETVERVAEGIAQRLNQRRRRAAPGRGRGRPRAESGPEQGASEPTAGPSTSRANGSARRRPRRHYGQRRRRKAKSPKKASPKKPRAPPKPLGPLTFHENWNGNEDYKNYLKLISKATHFRVQINYREGKCDKGGESPKVEVIEPSPSTSKNSNNKNGDSQNKTEEEDESSGIGPGYKIGELQFDRCSVHAWNWSNKAELLQAFPGISSLTLHVSRDPGRSILHLKNVVTLKGQDISKREGPLPKLPKRDSQRELIFVGTQHYFFHVDPVGGIPADMFGIRGLGSRKSFVIDFNRYDMSRRRFHFDVILLDSAIMGDHNVEEIPSGKFPLIQEIFTNFLGVAHPPEMEDESHQKEDIEWFYGQVKKYHVKEHLPTSDISLQPTSLKPTLRNYQRDAVHWMLYREGCFDHCEIPSSSSNQNHRLDLRQAFLDKMYVPVELTKYQEMGSAKEDEPEKRVVYYSVHTGYLCWTKPTLPPLPSGGILCDEMGLGKTVETLCLILLNQKKVPEDLQEYFGSDKKKDGIEDLEEEKAEENEESSSSEEEEESESNKTSESDSEDSEPKKKRKKMSVSKTPASTSTRTTRSSTNTNPRYKNTRRRAASPCEFTAADDDDDGEKSQKAEEPEQGPSRRRRSTSKQTTAFDYVEKKVEDLKRQRKKNRNGKSEGGKRPTLFEAMKVLYDSALSEYRFADYARSNPKFHGKFYDVDIEMRESFECICGESEDGCRDSEILKCMGCSSSQHAACVGFDMDLLKLYKKLGRQYLCPHCEALNPPFETKSTLIITPPSISHQWIKEIQRHVQNHRLNILFYKGVAVHGYIPPAKLARYDLVITTYSVLSSELDYVDLPHCNSADGRRFRNPKRFLTIPSPLPCVFWWRVVLDEAQMVEGINTKMSMMAMRLNAVHRWCVTGTPMNKGLQDLFGLFVFLKLSPINDEIWWNCLIRDSFFRKEPQLLYELFGQLIWRNGKQDVLDQLGIPPQTEIVHWLNFSPVETHFYKQQFEICSNKIREKIDRLRRSHPEVNMLDARLSTLDRFSLNGLLAPFLELRQACCHPQIVRGQVISLQKGPLTMEDLLERLIKKSQLKCMDDHRLAISSLNGLAGLNIIQHEFAQAASKYREVLQSVEKYKEHFKTDPLQLLHAIENLAELLDAHHDGIPFTLRDDSLRAEAADLRRNYMKKYADAVKAAQDVVSPISASVEEIQGQFTMHKESWWVAALKAAQRVQKSDGLIQTLKQDLLDVSKKNFHKTTSLANKFHDTYGLQRTIIPILLDMERNRVTVLEGLEELQSSDPSAFVESAIRCHLRQSSTQAVEKCKLCEYHDNFLFYESIIFKIENKDKISRTGRKYQQNKLMGELGDELDLTEETKEELLQQEAEDLKATTEHVQLINEELRRGHWGDSETEVILKGILRFARVSRLTSEICENGQVHMKFFEALKKEFRLLRILWRQIFDQVSALDELSQATTRLMVVDRHLNATEKKEEGRTMKQLKSGLLDKALKIQNINIVSIHEIDTRFTQTQVEHAGALEALSIHLGQLIYLKSLKKNGYGKKGTINTDDCPICSVQLGKEWSVLRCGHSFCTECVKKMCPNTLTAFLCPLCRHSMKYADVSFVDTTEDDRTNEDPIPGTSKKSHEIVGSHSTKVQSIVETLFELQDKHPGEKCIIFSMWVEVLEIIARALDQNGIMHSLLTQSGPKFHQNLDKFKERQDIQVLLMPLSSGAKGLNIIEATHVLLVEPILNVASELQAIGRVHRIGQTKPTFVHRFYIKRTIEEKLFQILKGQDISSDEEGSLTVKDLQNLVSISASSSSSNPVILN